MYILAFSIPTVFYKLSDRFKMKTIEATDRELNDTPDLDTSVTKDSSDGISKQVIILKYICTILLLTLNLAFS